MLAFTKKALGLPHWPTVPWVLCLTFLGVGAFVAPLVIVVPFEGKHDGGQSPTSSHFPSGFSPAHCHKKALEVVKLTTLNTLFGIFCIIRRNCRRLSL